MKDILKKDIIMKDILKKGILMKDILKSQRRKNNEFSSKKQLQNT